LAGYHGRSLNSTDTKHKPNESPCSALHDGPRPKIATLLVGEISCQVSWQPPGRPGRVQGAVFGGMGLYMPGCWQVCPREIPNIVSPRTQGWASLPCSYPVAAYPVTAYPVAARPPSHAAPAEGPWPSLALPGTPAPPAYPPGRPAGNSDQVPNLCAERYFGCMAVSRFFFFPILNNFSGIQNMALIALSRVMGPSGVVGYMRKQRFERIEATSPSVFSKQL
jgi:hypothetical protein